jgi:hypothetical protein
MHSGAPRLADPCFAPPLLEADLYSNIQGPNNALASEAIK